MYPQCNLWSCPPVHMDLWYWVWTVLQVYCTSWHHYCYVIWLLCVSLIVCHTCPPCHHYYAVWSSHFPSLAGRSMPHCYHYAVWSLCVPSLVCCAALYHNTVTMLFNHCYSTHSQAALRCVTVAACWLYALLLTCCAMLYHLCCMLFVGPLACTLHYTGSPLQQADFSPCSCSALHCAMCVVLRAVCP